MNSAQVSFSLGTKAVISVETSCLSTGDGCVFLFVFLHKLLVKIVTEQQVHSSFPLFNPFTVMISIHDRSTKIN